MSAAQLDHVGLLLVTLLVSMASVAVTAAGVSSAFKTFREEKRPGLADVGACSGCANGLPLYTAEQAGNVGGFRLGWRGEWLLLPPEWFVCCNSIDRFVLHRSSDHRTAVESSR